MFFQPNDFVTAIHKIDMPSLIRGIIALSAVLGLIHIRTDKLRERIKKLEDYIDVLQRKVHDHFYTIDPEEKRKAINEYNYKDENVACYVFPVDKDGKIKDGNPVPLYRLWLDFKKPQEIIADNTK
jgi:hypothetical protein